jgi:hypothetical protein
MTDLERLRRRSAARRRAHDFAVIAVLAGFVLAAGASLLFLLGIM